MLGGLPDNDLAGQIQRVLAFVRRSVVYVRDPVNAEYVVSPLRLLSQIAERGITSGDCDDHVMLLNSMLGSIGFSTRFIGVKIQPTDRFNHVISGVKISDKWKQLDPCVKSGKPYFYDETLTV